MVNKYEKKCGKDYRKKKVREEKTDSREGGLIGCLYLLSIAV